MTLLCQELFNDSLQVRIIRAAHLRLFEWRMGTGFAREHRQVRFCTTNVSGN